MQLSVADAARLLKVTEKTIYRWIKQGELPAYQVSDLHRFNRAELLEWATARHMNVSPEIFAEPAEEAAPLSLSQALADGGVHYGVYGDDKAAVLKSAVAMMKLPDEVDREFLYQVLLAREAMGSTGVGEGIAIPHVRNPIVLHMDGPLVMLCLLANPIDFGSVDGQPVQALFILICPTVRMHLSLLSRLGFLLRDADFKNAVLSSQPSEKILAALSKAEQATAVSKRVEKPAVVETPD
jgi:nitrogen PTS system EIIA component